MCASLSPPIVPVVRPFFSLVDLKSGRALCPYQFVNPNHQYVMRVFINTENSSCLGKYSSAARNYYFTQVSKYYYFTQVSKIGGEGSGIFSSVGCVG